MKTFFLLLLTFGQAVAEELTFNVKIEVPLLYPLDDWSGILQSTVADQLKENIGENLGYVNPFTEDEEVQPEIRVNLRDTSTTSTTVPSVADVTLIYTPPNGTDLTTIQIPDYYAYNIMSEVQINLADLRRKTALFVHDKFDARQSTLDTLTAEFVIDGLPETSEPTVTVNLMIPLEFTTVDEIDALSESQAKMFIQMAMQGRLMFLNPFENGSAKMDLELRDIDKYAIADVTFIYSPASLTDLTSIEFPSNFENEFTDVVQTLSSFYQLGGVVDMMKLTNVAAVVRIHLQQTQTTTIEPTTTMEPTTYPPTTTPIQTTTTPPPTTTRPLTTQPTTSRCSGLETFQDAIVTCEPGSFALTVPDCVFITNDLEDQIDSQIYLSPNGQPTDCYGQIQSGNVYYDANIDGCSATESNGTHYLRKSTLVYERGVANSVISRRSFVRVNFACATPIIFVSLSNGIATSEISVNETLEHEAMNIEVAMGLFESQSFTNQITNVTEMSYGIEEPMFVGISLINGDDMEFRLKNCWATPESDQNSATSYSFIEDYCPNSDDLDNDYLEIYGSQGSWGFRLASFKFVNHSCAELYLHCEVTICYDTECDDLTCNTLPRRRRRRRSTSSGTTTLNSSGIQVC